MLFVKTVLSDWKKSLLLNKDLASPGSYWRKYCVECTGCGYVAGDQDDQGVRICRDHHRTVPPPPCLLPGTHSRSEDQQHEIYFDVWNKKCNFINWVLTVGQSSETDDILWDDTTKNPQYFSK